jgi:hypothetical protein
VQGGVRTPKLRTSTSTDPCTTPGTILRGKIIRGLGHGFPVESIVCSQAKQVAFAVPWRFKNTSGSVGCVNIFSKYGSVPYSVILSTRKNQPSSASRITNLPLLFCIFL